MKKILSLALASVLCLSLSAPALAANQSGDTTVTDAKGNTYTLSNPILYTISKEQLAQLPFTEDYVCYSVAGESHNPEESSLKSVSMAYAVPNGTTITPPADTTTTMPDGSIEVRGFSLEPTAMEVRKSGNEYAIAYEEYYPMYPCDLSSSVNALWVIECYETRDTSGNGGGGGGSNFIGSIAFFTPISADLQNSFPGGSSSTDNPTTPTTPITPTSPNNPTFTDVAANAYYADSVNWAVEMGITSGTSATTFSPNQTCTTAQILTFLWRAQGSPEPTSKVNPFTDVKESDYFYKAALWAKENNILPTTNANSTVFNGNTPCTRGMAVLYIWRAAGFHAAKTPSNFTDVADTTLYAPAVDWAVEAGVTSGTSETTFSPDTTCTRAQIVTFLYRAFAE